MSCTFLHSFRVGIATLWHAESGSTPEQCCTKTWPQDTFAWSGSAHQCCSHNLSWHILHHVRHGFRPQQCIPKMRALCSSNLPSKMRSILLALCAPYQKCGHCSSVDLKNANHCLAHNKMLDTLHSPKMRTVPCGVSYILECTSTKMRRHTENVNTTPDTQTG